MPRSAAKRLILASSSPRRRELLAEAGYRFEVVPPSADAECGLCSGETAPEYAARMARQKAADVAARVREGLVIGCDTVVECQGQVLGKPRDVTDARAMLRHLRGREHRVYSGLCLWDTQGGPPQVRLATTVLRMGRLTDAQIEEYLATDQWAGKAGAFGYQDRLGWIEIVEGSESNVVGLPLELLEEMLRAVTPR
jgi:septum formation protein